ncbi:MAG: PspC domain-containing protein [Tessaracoccus sp.]|uniref:ATP-binding protein n=1 Tax=Tessaracoccus sp. TaxID=1971211 RepID=UPI001EC173A0|nr:ATP-binding protein [Tessaracoccus sp.]MBK7821714.1 PspC domain-containing protein [Tessaracoccus sp.]
MSQLPVAPDAPARAPLRRADDGAMIAGVAQGLATHLGLSVNTVRLAFVILALFSGAGALAYGVLWVLVPRATGAALPAGLEAASRRGMRPAAARPARPDDGVLIAGAVIAVGLLWLFVSGGALPSRLFWPAVIGGAGVVTIWLQVDEHVAMRDDARRGLWQRITRGGGTMSVVRLVGGLVLVGLGVSWILATQIGLSQLPGVLGASGVLLAGVAVVAAPWLYQQRARVRQADAARLREAARADMAAHLHDSVLQTLALIQRQADDPAAVAQLARKQERELRTWLYGETARAASLRSALREVVVDVEGRFAVDVELVCVGDADVDSRVEALVMAVGEAVTNAAKHSGAPRIDVYAEVEDGHVEVFVRDRGKGFDPDVVPAGRMGVRESIKARMERHGGTASIRSEPGHGTEVRVEIG